MEPATGFQSPASQAGTPDDEEVFQDTQEEHPTASRQEGRRKSDRKRPSVDYCDAKRHAKKQRDSQGAAKSLVNLEGEPQKEDQFAQLMSMIKALDRNINKKLDVQSRDISRRLSQATADIEESLINIETKVHRVTEEVANLDKRVKTQEKKLPRMIDLAVGDKMTEVLSRVERLEQDGASDPKKSRKEAAYWEARRSLRLAPIEGDLLEGVKKFIIETLGLDEGIVEGINRSAIRRVPLRQSDRIKNEVVVHFPSGKDRDSVKAAGFSLTGTQCAMRLELPSHLLAQHRLLSQAAQNLRKSKTGTRTNIKFDDNTMDMVLDYRLDGGQWT